VENNVQTNAHIKVLN